MDREDLIKALENVPDHAQIQTKKAQSWDVGVRYLRTVAGSPSLAFEECKPEECQYVVIG